MGLRTDLLVVLGGLLFATTLWAGELEYRHSVHLTVNKPDNNQLSLKNLDKVYESMLQQATSYGLRSTPGTNFNNPYAQQPTCDYSSKYRTIDGTCNNMRNPWYGAAKTPLQRIVPNTYEDGINEPTSSFFYSPGKLPTAREVSLNVMLTQSNISQKFSHLLMNFGQFVDHDLTLSPESGGEGGQEAEKMKCCVTSPEDYAKENLKDCLPIFTPNDPIFKRTCIPFLRSAAVPGFPGSEAIRHQLNDLTAYIDGSQIYGSTNLKAAALRSFSGGKLKSARRHGEEQLPLEANSPSNCLAKKAECQFAAGDIRSSEQAGLTSVHTLFLREHNRIAKELSHLNPNWVDEEIYQTARKIMGGMMQRLVYGEFLPVILGPQLMGMFGLELKDHGRFHGYSAEYDPSVVTEFSTAAFRFGHSLVRQTFSHSPTGESDLEEMFDSFKTTDKHGTNGFMKGLTSDHGESCERFVVQGLRDKLFGDEADLPAFNIQRGRDHGISSYNELRRSLGLQTYSSYSNMATVTHPMAAANDMKKIYPHPEDMEIFPAGLSERVLDNAVVGETFGHVIAKQFRNVKYGDRFWHETGDVKIGFTDAQLQEIRKTSFAALYCDNVPGAKVRQNLLLVESFMNPEVDCNHIPRIDLSKWKVGSTHRNSVYEPRRLKNKLNRQANERRRNIHQIINRRKERQRRRQQALEHLIPRRRRNRKMYKRSQGRGPRRFSHYK